MTKLDIATAAVGFMEGKGLKDTVVPSMLNSALEAAGRRDEIADTVLQKCFQAIYEAGRKRGFDDWNK